MKMRAKILASLAVGLVAITATGCGSHLANNAVGLRHDGRVHHTTHTRMHHGTARHNGYVRNYNLEGTGRIGNYYNNHNRHAAGTNRYNHNLITRDGVYLRDGATPKHNTHNTKRHLRDGHKANRHINHNTTTNTHNPAATRATNNAPNFDRTVRENRYLEQGNVVRTAPNNTSTTPIVTNKSKNNVTNS